MLITLPERQKILTFNYGFACDHTNCTATVHVVESDKMNTWQFDSLDTDVEPGVRHYCPKHHIRNGW